MTFRLYGLPEEDRLAIEEASGGTIDTEAARIIIERSVQQAEEITRAAIREVQEVIGPHGSVTRLQAGGVRITPGAGIGVFTDGVAKTNIQNNGTLVIGSDITDPRTTTEVFFTEDTIYNGEQFLAGDFLIGDNTIGSANVKYSSSDGQLQFRGGQTVQAYMDTDGSIKAGGGDVTIDEWGITFANQEGLIQFLDTNGGGTLVIYAALDNALVLENSFGGGHIAMQLNDSSDVIHWIEFYDGNIDLLDGEYRINGATVLTNNAWGSFTPSWTNLTVGDGTNVGKYIQIGKTVHYRISFTFGSTSSISGAVQVGFPVTAVSMITDQKVGDLSMRDVSVFSSFAGIAAWASTTLLQLRVFDTSGTYAVLSNLSSTVPFTWAVGDLIAISGTYEAA